MKKIKKRAYSAFLIAILLLAGMTTYVVRFIMDGEGWATFSGNEGVYDSGKIAVGTVTDRNGTVLAKADGSCKTYNEDSSIRVSTLHALGDYDGFIGTGALTSFADRLTGYSAVGGLASGGAKLELAIDSQLCVTAYYALAGRSGAVLVMDYTTGEIICMVSSPSYDPTMGFDEADSAFTGAYINRSISSRYTPGSVFKIVTLAAALENIADIYEREFDCAGSFEVGGYNVTCAGTHGKQTIEQAFANSCNCAFGNLALELGGEKLAEYAQKLGLTEKMTVNGIETAAGLFEPAPDDTPALAWSGIGQHTNLVSPISMLRLVSAVANGGAAAKPSILLGETGGSDKLLSKETADKISEMMNYNVAYAYGGEWYFPGLNISAKSGTAEVGDGNEHSWFTGFLNDEEHPYAFVVIIENGGGGLRNAGAVANTVLQAAVKEEN